MIESAQDALNAWNHFQPVSTPVLPGLEEFSVAGIPSNLLVLTGRVCVAGAVVSALGVEVIGNCSVACSCGEMCWIEVPLAATWSFGQAQLVARRYRVGWISDVVCGHNKLCMSQIV